ncbi:AIM24 [Candida margitis]|uniref:AIM24 n=1 Tax=Candida margitis TaxID=1775924 RepID=UPI00222659AE|nr:AIM24 [Candida margitis]KAI5966074.1 AIM24 [Candida margitis]
MAPGMGPWRPPISLRSLQPHSFPQSLSIATRHISINHKSAPQDTTATTTPVEDANNAALTKTITDSDNISQVTQLKPYQTLETAKFESLGTPPTILSIHSPPSVPIYLRRGSLLSMYGLKSSANTTNFNININNNNSASGTLSSTEVTDDGPVIRNTIEYPHWWKRLILMGKFQSFQNIISTIPISLLISSKNKSNNRATSDSSFVSLILDGSNDWAVLNNDAIQVYTGNSLSISLHNLPRYISKKFAKQLSGNNNTSRGTKVETGLKSWSNRGYTLLGGRGQVGLVGNGGIYQLDVDEGEEILINKRAILAITVNGPFDLENCVVKDTSAISQQTLASVVASSDTKVSKQHIASTSPQATTSPSPSTYRQIKSYWLRISQSTKSVVSYLGRIYHQIKTKWTIYSLGTTDFVKINGPRNILIQSNYNVPTTTTTTNTQKQSTLSNNSRSIQSISNTRISAQPVFENPSTRNSSDYLSYVTIEPERGAVFANTPNFKPTVDEIERKSDNKSRE